MTTSALDTFATIAALSIALAGFTGIVVGLGNVRIKRGARSYLSFARLLESSLSVTFFALGAMVLVEFDLSDRRLFQLVSGAAGVWGLGSLAYFGPKILPHAMKSVEGVGVTRIASSLSILATILLLLHAIGVVAPESAGPLLVGLVMQLAVGCLMFMRAVMSGAVADS